MNNSTKTKFIYGNHIDFDEKLELSRSLISLCNRLAKRGCKDVVFTRFPFYNSSKRYKSKTLGIKYKEGNCVSFAYYMQHILKQNGLKGYVVGAKPPSIFAREGYNEISHAAVILPFNKGYLLFDTAFYFHKVIIVKNDGKMCNKTFKNVYSRTDDMWSFMLNNNDNTIKVMINGEDVESYYQLKPIINPHESITIPTNSIDKSIFRCEIDKYFVSKIYYNLNFNKQKKILSILDKNNEKTVIPISYFFDMENKKFNKSKLKSWVDGLHVSKKNKMIYDITSILSNYTLVNQLVNN